MNQRTAIDGVSATDVFRNADLAQPAMLPLYVGLILIDGLQQLLTVVGIRSLECT